MNNKEIKAKIEKMIANGYAETHIGYHAEYRIFNTWWSRGCYAHIAEPYNGSYRLYADSWQELLDLLESIPDFRL